MRRLLPLFGGDGEKIDEHAETHLPERKDRERLYHLKNAANQSSDRVNDCNNL